MNYRKKCIAFALVTIILQTIIIPTFATEVRINMTDMAEYSSAGTWAGSEITDSYGNTYTNNTLRFDASEHAYVTYNLNGEFISFHGMIAVANNAESESSMNLGIFADGKNVFSVAELTRQQKPIEVSLDLEGVRTLEIKTSKNREFSSRDMLYFVDSYFLKANYPVAITNWDDLDSLTCIDSEGYWSNQSLFTDSHGEFHNGIHEFVADESGYALFYLDKQFDEFQGKIVVPRYSASESDVTMTLVIYLDNIEVFRQKGMTNCSEAIDFSLNVTNSDVLMIQTEFNGARLYDGFFVGITDEIFIEHSHKSEEWIVETPATCDETGERYMICRECGELFNQEEIPRLSHIGDGIWRTVNEVSCTEEGVEEMLCILCGEAFQAQYTSAAGHSDDRNWEITSTPTCSSVGKMIRICSVCGEIVEEKVIPTARHDFGDWSISYGNIWNNPIVKARSCTICGYTEQNESFDTSWLQPLVIVIILILCGGGVVVILTLKINGKTMDLQSILRLTNEDKLSEKEIDNILKK